MRHCSICNREVDEQEAPILAMGGFGNPKYLCEECSSDIDTAMESRDVDAIEAAMSRISEKLSDSGADVPIVVETVTEIFSAAGDRAKKIKAGTYDFSEDEAQEENEQDDVPEELLESEEDKALDEIEKEKNRVLDTVFNCIALGVFIAVIALAIIYFLR